MGKGRNPEKRKRKNVDQMVQQRLSSKHAVSLSPQWRHCCFKEVKSETQTHMQLCVKHVSPLGVCMFSISLYLFLCTDVCLLSHGQRRVTQIRVVCLLTQLHWNTRHHPHLSWAVFPHLCCGSNITASPTSICYRQRTLPRTSLRFRIASCLTHL